MQSISAEGLRLVERDAPDVRDAVRQAKEAARGTRKAAHISLRLERFEDDPFLLYSCLWFARSEGVEVRLPAK